jgi:ABC-type sugar transport system ATPase subunit
MIEAPPSPKPSIKPRLVSSESSPMIAVRALAKKIGQQEILRGVDLEVATGETLAIIGRSGGGKSVLLKHLVGLMRPDAGEIWIEGQSIIKMSERQLGVIRQKVGILFQGGALFDSMTVEENIAFPLREAGERDPEGIALEGHGNARSDGNGRRAGEDARELKWRNEETRRSRALDYSPALLCVV